MDDKQVGIHSAFGVTTLLDRAGDITVRLDGATVTAVWVGHKSCTQRPGSLSQTGRSQGAKSGQVADEMVREHSGLQCAHHR